jgi:hypothetical protein
LFFACFVSADLYLCPGLGRFPNPDATKCNTYYICTFDTTNRIVPILVECELDQYANGYCQTGVPTTCSLPYEETFNPAGLVCNGLAAMPNYPNKFYECIVYNGVPRYNALSCPTGEIWVSGTTCEPGPNYVPPTNLPLLSNPTTICSNGGGFYPNPNPSQCNTFLECWGATVTGTYVSQFQCPLPLVWSQIQQSCVRATIGSCMPPASVCPTDGAQPDSFDCTNFYNCKFGQPQLSSCERDVNGLYFDPSISACTTNEKPCGACNFCQANPKGYYTLPDVAYGVTCTSAQIGMAIQDNNIYVNGGRSFAYCSKNGPVLAFCCGDTAVNFSASNVVEPVCS